MLSIFRTDINFEKFKEFVFAGDLASQEMLQVIFQELVQDICLHRRFALTGDLVLLELLQAILQEIVQEISLYRRFSPVKLPVTPPAKPNHQ